MNININEDIIIVTTKFGLSIAQNLSEELQRLNFSVAITNNPINTDKLHIILFSFLLPQLPKNYILYQLEQIGKSNNLTNKIQDDIKNSLLTLDYSKVNISKYIIHKKNISYQMMPISNKIIEYYPEYSYDVIFFGTLNEHRRKILEYLSKQNIVVANTDNIFGDNLYFHVKKAKIVLNLHYYDDAILEVARLNEILKYNTLIISENSNLINDNHDYYKNDIFFVENIDKELDNINILTEQIFDCLQNFDVYKKKINKIRKHTIQQIYDEFSQNLKKNLISINYINSKLLNIEIDFNNKILCICNTYFYENFKKINNKFLDLIYFFENIKNKDKNIEKIINYKVLCENLIASEYQYIVCCNLTSILPENLLDIYNIIIDFFIKYDNDIYFNMDKIYDKQKLLFLDNYNNISFYNYNNMDNSLFDSSFLILSRNFANKFLEKYNEVQENINIDDIIKNNKLNVITNKINFFSKD